MSNNGGVYTWSKTAGNNASADNTVNWLEGQAPSSINDSARALMTSVAKYRDDISGAIVTTGTSAAYIVASNQNFDTLADFHGQVIAFTPHVTNAAVVTVTVDGFANLPLRSAPNSELLAGVLIQGSPYLATYNNTDGSLYLHGFFGNPYNIPLGGGLDYWLPTAPNSSFAFPIGQAISRTTFATLFAGMGTTHGAGDGSTTFNLPDRRGRGSAQLDPSGAILTSASMSPNGNALGAKGGLQAATLVTANLPPYTPAGSIGSASADITFDAILGASSGTNVYRPGAAAHTPLNVTATFTGTPAPGQNSTPFNIVQPTILCNYIIRII